MRALIGSSRVLLDILTVELLIFFIITFSPFMYGGITPLPLMLIQLSGLLLVSAYALRLLVLKEFEVTKVTIWPLAALILFLGMQLVNIPSNLMALLSPSTEKIYLKYLVHYLNLMPLSICLESSVGLFLQLIIYSMVFIVLVNYVNTEEKCRRIINIIILCGIFYSLLGFLKRGNAARFVFSTFTNSNHFAAYIQMTVFLSLGYALSFKNKTIRFLLFFFTSIMIAALFYSQSRTGRVAFILGLIAFFILLKFSKRIDLKFNLWIIVLVVFLALLVGIIGITPLISRMETLSNPLGEYYVRFVFIKDSLQVFKDFPFFGAGLGTFGDIAQKYKTLGDDFRYTFVHNEPIQLLVETGAFGFIFCFIFFSAIIRNIIITLIKRRNHFVFFTVLGGTLGLSVVIFSSLFDFIFHVPAVAILFLVILALLYRMVYINTQQSDLIPPVTSIKPKFYLKIAILVVIFVALFSIGKVVISRYQAELIFDQVKEEKVSDRGVEGVIHYKKILDKFSEAIRLNPVNSKYFYAKANLFAQLAVDESLKSDLSALDDFGKPSDLLIKAKFYYGEAIRLNPTNADYHLKLGWVYKNIGDVNLAKEHFGKAVSLDPQNSRLREYVKLNIGE